MTWLSRLTRVKLHSPTSRGSAVQSPQTTRFANARLSYTRTNYKRGALRGTELYIHEISLFIPWFKLGLMRYGCSLSHPCSSAETLASEDGILSS
jgi:hypothetical protein